MLKLFSDQARSPMQWLASLIVCALWVAALGCRTESTYLIYDGDGNASQRPSVSIRDTASYMDHIADLNLTPEQAAEIAREYLRAKRSLTVFNHPYLINNFYVFSVLRTKDMNVFSFSGVYVDGITGEVGLQKQMLPDGPVAIYVSPDDPDLAYYQKAMSAPPP